MRSTQAALRGGLCLIALLMVACSTAPTLETSTITPPSSAVSPAAALAAACSGCHREGVSGTVIATLGSYGVAELDARLRGFKNAESEATAMHRLARGYTDAELAALAGYLGTQVSK